MPRLATRSQASTPVLFGKSLDFLACSGRHPVCHTHLCPDGRGATEAGPSRRWRSRPRGASFLGAGELVRGQERARRKSQRHRERETRDRSHQLRCYASCCLFPPPPLAAPFMLRRSGRLMGSFFGIWLRVFLPVDPVPSGRPRLVPGKVLLGKYPGQIPADFATEPQRQLARDRVLEIVLRGGATDLFCLQVLFFFVYFVVARHSSFDFVSTPSRKTQPHLGRTIFCRATPGSESTIVTRGRQAEAQNVSISPPGEGEGRACMGQNLAYSLSVFWMSFGNIRYPSRAAASCEPTLPFPPPIFPFSKGLNINDPVASATRERFACSDTGGIPVL